MVLWCNGLPSCNLVGGNPLQVLRPVASWPGNTDTIFSLAYDAPRNRIITGAKDSQVRSQLRTKPWRFAVQERCTLAAVRAESRDCWTLPHDAQQAHSSASYNAHRTAADKFTLSDHTRGGSAPGAGV